MTTEDAKILEDLQTKLKVIGWLTIHRGCDHYQLVNNKKEVTGFILWGERLQLSTHGLETCFGKSRSGVISIYLTRCEIVIESPNDDPFVSIFPKGDSEQKPSIFFSFYRHD